MTLNPRNILVIDFGQLGDGSLGVVPQRPTPGPVAGLTDAVALAVGDNHACAVRRDGTLVYNRASKRSSHCPRCARSEKHFLMER